MKWRFKKRTPLLLSCEVSVKRWSFRKRGCSECKLRPSYISQYYYVFNLKIKFITFRNLLVFWMDLYYLLFSVGPQTNSRLDRLIVKVSRSHTHTHTHTHTQPASTTTLNEWTVGRRDRDLHNTQQTKQTTIRALCGIRNGDPFNQATPRLTL